MDKSVGSLGTEKLLEVGKRPSEATLNLQRELLDTYCQSGRAWVSRAQKEMELWSQLTASLAASRSVPEAVAAYQECMSQRMQMGMDDLHRFAEDYQGFMAKLTRSLSSNWTGGSTNGPGPAKRRS